MRDRLCTLFFYHKAHKKDFIFRQKSDLTFFTAMGVAAVMASFTLAINSFFKERRARAIGVGMSITGIGSFYTPLLISLLINTYGWRGAVFVLSAICLHSLLGASLLRPAKWYLKYPPSPEEELVALNNYSPKELQESTVTTSSRQNGHFTFLLLLVMFVIFSNIV